MVCSPRLDGDDATAEARFGAAIEELSALGYPYWLARAQTDLAGVLIDDHRRCRGTAHCSTRRSRF